MKKVLNKRISVAWVFGIALASSVVGGLTDHLFFRPAPIQVLVSEPEHGLSGLSGDTGLSGIAGSAPVGPAYYVNPTTGNDSNNGLTPATAIQTWGKLVTSAGDGTLKAGRWPTQLSSITSTAAAQSWYRGYKAGAQLPSGSRVIIDTSGGPLQATAQLNLPLGCQIMSASAALTNIKVNRTLTDTWTTTAQANVFVTTSANVYTWTMIYQYVSGQPAQLTGIVAANSTTALPLLQATAGSFWVDPTSFKLYVHSLTNGNPGSDGQTYEYVPQWAAGLEGPVITVRGGRAYRIGTDGGSSFVSVDGTSHGVEGLGHQEWGQITVLDTCTVTRSGDHSFGMTGNTSSGLTVLRNCQAQTGPGGVAFGNWGHFVPYTSFSGTGTIDLIFDGCSTLNGIANLGTSGGNDNETINGCYLAMLAHTNDATLGFRSFTFNACTFRGTVTVGANTATVTDTNSIMSGSFAGSPTTLNMTGTTVGSRMPGLTAGTTTLTNCSITPTAVFQGTPANLSGTVTFSGCTIDLSGGVTFSTAWTRSGTYALSITGGSIRPYANTIGGNNAYGLITAMTAGTDTVALSGLNVIGPSGLALILNYNATGLPKSYYDAFALGWATTCTHNGIAFAVPATLAGIVPADVAEFYDFVGTTEAWQNTTFLTTANTATNPVRSVAGSYFGSQMLAPATGQRPLRSANGIILDAVDDGMTCPRTLTVGSAGYMIVCVEKLTGTTTSQSRRTVQSETLGNRIGSLSRGSGDNFYLGGDVSTYRQAPDTLRHTWLWDCPAAGNIKLYVDNVDKTTGTIAAADWGGVSLGNGNGGAGAAPEPADTTVQYLWLIKRTSTGSTERTAIFSAMAALP